MCGDGQKKAGEACDDGNTTSGDGCSAGCAVEAGFTCVGSTPSVCLAVCGDGQKKGAEQCDDGNAAAGDGCGPGCTIEQGFTCTGSAPSVCAAVCGDGKQKGSEACDDGNAVSGDGCSATCAVEPGYTCAGSPSTCTPICGDGQKKASEACDDGNATNGDGCSSNCLVEPGYTCAGSPSTCSGICGDGQTKGSEACDDGNTDDGDGCSASCVVEPGYTCAGSPSACTPICGDGLITAWEICDDHNTAAGDGCSPTCTIEDGFDCVGSPSVCSGICGDGEKKGAEACDDGNFDDGDGCSSLCTVEPGFTCAGSPSECAPVCGDGIVAGYEECDDHNGASDDGCSSSCFLEPGFTCSGSPLVCTTTCGDGVRAGNEQCDDGNTTDGDCCSATCQAEPGCEVESNDTPATATPYASIVMSGVAKGRILPYGDADHYLVLVPPGLTGTILVETMNGFLGSTCSSGMDTVVRLYDAHGVMLDADDDSGPGLCSRLQVSGLPPGSYYVEVVGYSSSYQFDYTLSITQTFVVCGDGTQEEGEQCDDGNTVNGDGCSSNCRLEFTEETEPNDTCAAPNGPYLIPPGPDGIVVAGTVSPTSDQDWFSFTVPVYADVRFETFDMNGPGGCLGIDSVIQVYNPSCTALGLARDDGGIDNCSLLDPAYDAQVRHLAPGNYAVRVTSHGGSSSFGYTLQATLVSQCGDGVITGSEQCDGTPGCEADCTLIPACGNAAREAGEQCDDGNTTSGDGCSAACQWEKLAEVEPNDTPAAADAALPAITKTTNITGAISAIGDADLFKVTVATTRVVRFEIFDPSGTDCIAMPTTALALLDADGAELAIDVPQGDTAGSGIGGCAALVANLAPGSYYIKAARLSSGTLPAYFLQIQFETDNGVEVEPNDTDLEATPNPGTDTFITGAHQAGAIDVYAITVPPGPGLSLRAEIVEGGAETCESYNIDSVLSLYDEQGNYLAYDDDDGRGYCSMIDGTGATPRDPDAHLLKPGTYYIEVGENNFADFDYRLAVTLR